jgi:hypothetical protein
MGRTGGSLGKTYNTPIEAYNFALETHRKEQNERLGIEKLWTEPVCLLSLHYLTIL